MRGAVKHHRPGRMTAIALAVLVHVLAIGILFVSYRWSGEPAAPPSRVVQAVAVKEPKRDEAQEKLKAEAQRQAEEAERRRKAEEQARLEAQRKKEIEAKRQAEAERKRKEAEAKKRAEEERRQQEATRKRKEAEAAKQRAAQERRRQAEQALKEQLAAEERDRVAAARAARAASEAEKFKALIRQKVSRNWSEPPGASKGLECVVRVRVVPGGEVLSAQIVRSSGNAVFDSSVENAVYKATPLPLPSDPELFEYLREIEFTFRPQG